MNSTLRFKVLIISALCLFSFDSLEAQKKKKKKGEEEKPKTEEKTTIASKVKGHDKIEGLFTFYRDTTSGSIMMEVNKEQLDKEYIYFSQIADGVLEAYSFRGAYRGSDIFKIRKFYNELEFVKVNTNFYYDPENPLSRSQEANMSNSLLASEKIEVEEDGNFLIKADNLFLKETWSQIKPPSLPGQSPTSFKLGSLSSEKTKVRAIRSYPQNVDFKVEYVYSTSSVLNGGSNAIADARNVSISVFHSLVAVPENDYEPRFDDPRVGYFTTQVDDQTTTEAIAYRDMINRWHLVKKDPEAAISEPVEPITWWIENTTPLEWRESIKQGVLEWNKAFEKAGFKNAMVVKVQPDTADWDAGDIRYNVLRWTSSPNPPFGGYGPSFRNPRTGQIIGADIMLEFVHHTNRVRYTKLYGMEVSNKEAPFWNPEGEQNYCMYSSMMLENNLFGEMAIATNGEDLDGMKNEAMLELIMHEVGHTLGLNHNMKSSQLYSPEQLADKEFIQGKALTGSVMDYATINVTKDRSKQGHYYSTVIGPYDVWAIQFGYTPDMSEEAMNKLLARSTEPELMFGNDADDMRSSSRGIDPRINTGDLSNDQITYSIDRIELVDNLMKDLREKYNDPGESYQELRQAYYILSRQRAQAGEVMSRFIGGIYVDRAMQGQPGATKPYTPVSESEQKRAMNGISKYMFAPNAFNTSNDIYNYLALQRRGYNFYRGPEDPKIHESVLSAQKDVLSHLLHENTLQRLVDSELYGNSYQLGEFMVDLNSAIFDADINGSVNTFRQNLQVEYTKMLIEILLKDKSGSYSNHAKSMALYNLNAIDRKATNSSGNTLSRAHKSHLRALIKNALDEYKG
ncbi:MAG: zinc-dependent metalloprotease [Fulvivirga sp.]|uniref:zinc-dependent metalloprotease n=1 Tax=Fulvivirga sp. TaxID=1931237 RepID=UPI0032EE03D4